MRDIAVLDHLPILQVAVPLLVAPLCVLIGHRGFSRGVTILVAAGMFLISLLLAAQVYPDGSLHYLLGGWPAPWGIEYRVDMLTVAILLTINLVNLVASMFSISRSDRKFNRRGSTAFYASWLLCVAGLNGMVVTNDAFNVFVFLEISSLSTYVLISCGRDPKSLLAAYRYLIMGAIGATFILLSVGLLYMQAGTLNITDLSVRIADQGASRTMIMALVFFVVGIAIKCGIMPFHDWLPNAYCYAPNTVTALLSGTATKVAIYVLLRFMHDLFSVGYSLGEMPIDLILLACAIAGMLIAPLIAIRESSLKRMFAWSSVAQISYVIVGVCLGTEQGVAAALLHVFNHSVVKVMVFIAVGILIARTGTDRIKHLGSVAHTHRLASYVILFGGLGLIGIPGTVGFVSKWVLINAAVEQGSWWLSIPILLGSLASVSYIWRIVEILWAKPADLDLDGTRSPITVAEWFPLIAIALVTLWFGLNASLSMELAALAASSLSGG